MGLFFLAAFVVCTLPALAVSQETTPPAQTPQSHADHQMDTAPPCRPPVSYRLRDGCVVSLGAPDACPPCHAPGTPPAWS